MVHKIVVIGAGAQGAQAAIQLAQQGAQQGYEVVLLEKGKSLIPETSTTHNECYKLHLGLHYPGDVATARYCLISAVALARELPQVLESDDLSEPWRRGRYYFMSNSLVLPEAVKNVKKNLQELYETLVSNDPKNEVFGKPENFMRILNQSDYTELAENIPYYDQHSQPSDVQIDFGIETAESQININALRAVLKEKIDSKPNITFMPNTEVVEISADSYTLGYSIKVKTDQEKFNVITCDGIVNCAWQNSELLDKTGGFYSPDEQRILRIKVSVLVTLPEPLRHLNTCTFASGPFASITVLKNGTAILTSERITNAGFYQAGSELPHTTKQLLKELTLDTEKGQSMAKQILVDCASYFNTKHQELFLTSTINELRVGYVKMMGNKSQIQYTGNSIYEANSSIHERKANGIETVGLCYIRASGDKMTFTLTNAQVIPCIMESHFQTREKMDALIKGAKKTLLQNSPNLKLNPILRKEVDLALYKTNREKLRQAMYSTQDEAALKRFLEKIVLTETGVGIVLTKLELEELELNQQVQGLFAPVAGQRRMRRCWSADFFGPNTHLTSICNRSLYPRLTLHPRLGSLDISYNNSKLFKPLACIADSDANDVFTSRPLPNLTTS